MANMIEMAERCFSRQVLNEMTAVYDRRLGGYDTVDRDAVQSILDRFPEKTDTERLALTNYGAFMTR